MVARFILLLSWSPDAFVGRPRRWFVYVVVGASGNKKGLRGGDLLKTAASGLGGFGGWRWKTFRFLCEILKLDLYWKERERNEKL